MPSSPYYNAGINSIKVKSKAINHGSVENTARNLSYEKGITNSKKCNIYERISQKLLNVLFRVRLESGQSTPP